jgi:hypothetical protein
LLDSANQPIHRISPNDFILLTTSIIIIIIITNVLTNHVYYPPSPPARTPAGRDFYCSCSSIPDSSSRIRAIPTTIFDVEIDLSMKKVTYLYPIGSAALPVSFLGHGKDHRIFINSLENDEKKCFL